jgi:hypothetical protein
MNGTLQFSVSFKIFDSSSFVFFPFSSLERATTSMAPSYEELACFRSTVHMIRRIVVAGVSDSTDGIGVEIDQLRELLDLALQLLLVTEDTHRVSALLGDGNFLKLLQTILTTDPSAFRCSSCQAAIEKNAFVEFQLYCLESLRSILLQSRALDEDCVSLISQQLDENHLVEILLRHANTLRRTEKYHITVLESLHVAVKYYNALRDAATWESVSYLLSELCDTKHDDARSYILGILAHALPLCWKAKPPSAELDELFLRTVGTVATCTPLVFQMILVSQLTLQRFDLATPMHKSDATLTYLCNLCLGLCHFARRLHEQRQKGPPLEAVLNCLLRVLEDPEVMLRMTTQFDMLLDVISTLHGLQLGDGQDLRKVVQAALVATADDKHDVAWISKKILSAAFMEEIVSMAFAPIESVKREQITANQDALGEAALTVALVLVPVFFGDRHAAEKMLERHLQSPLAKLSDVNHFVEHIQNHFLNLNCEEGDSIKLFTPCGFPLNIPGNLMLHRFPDACNDPFQLFGLITSLYDTSMKGSLKHSPIEKSTHEQKAKLTVGVITFTIMHLL